MYLHSMFVSRWRNGYEGIPRLPRDAPLELIGEWWDDPSRWTTYADGLRHSISATEFGKALGHDDDFVNWAVNQTVVGQEVTHDANLFAVRGYFDQIWPGGGPRYDTTPIGVETHSLDWFIFLIAAARFLRRGVSLDLLGRLWAYDEFEAVGLLLYVSSDLRRDRIRANAMDFLIGRNLPKTLAPVAEVAFLLACVNVGANRSIEFPYRPSRHFKVFGPEEGSKSRVLAQDEMYKELRKIFGKKMIPGWGRPPGKNHRIVENAQFLFANRVHGVTATELAMHSADHPEDKILNDSAVLRSVGHQLKAAVDDLEGRHSR